jgi:hypothetical protein
MSAIRFISMPTETADAFRAGRLDANGQAPERRVAEGGVGPCRHCQKRIVAGEAYLTLAYRPFAALQPFAECGPIFLHADACERYPESAAMPAMFNAWQHALLRGYGADDRIVYGTGIVVPPADVEATAEKILAEAGVRYVHLRSSTNNCYQLRIERS